MDEQYLEIVERTPPVVVEIDLASEASEVWTLVSDIDLPARFSDEFTGADWHDPPGTGARFTGRNRRGDIGDWQTECTVTAWNPGRTFEWTVGDVEDPTASWRYDIESIDAGSRLKMTARLGPGRSFLRAFVRRHPDQAEAIIAARLDEWRRNMQATVDGVRELLEPT